MAKKNTSPRQAADASYMDMPSVPNGNSAKISNARTAAATKITKKRTATEDPEILVPTKKRASAKDPNSTAPKPPAEDKAGDKAASKPGTSGKPNTDNTLTHGANDDEVAGDGLQDEGREYEDLVGKVRHKYNQMKNGGLASLAKPKSGKDEVLEEVVALAKETVLFMVSKNNPEDASKFQDIEKIKRFELIREPDEMSDGLSDGTQTAVMRKSGRLIVSANTIDEIDLIVEC